MQHLSCRLRCTGTRASCMERRRRSEIAEGGHARSRQRSREAERIGVFCGCQWVIIDAGIDDGRGSAVLGVQCRSGDAIALDEI